MPTFQIPVTFRGHVTVTLPENQPLLRDEEIPMSAEDGLLLATKLALSRVLATVENPDAPDMQAFDEYEAECSVAARETAINDWDSAKVLDIGGAWNRTGEEYASIGWSVDEIVDMFDVTDEEAIRFLTDYGDAIHDELIEPGLAAVQAIGKQAGLKKKRHLD